MVACFAKLLEAAFTGAGSTSRDSSNVEHHVGNGGLAKKDPSAVSQSQFFSHSPDGPEQLVREGVLMTRDFFGQKSCRMLICDLGRTARSQEV